MRELALCAGIGGMQLGLKLAARSHRTICYVEREAFAVNHLAEKGAAGALDRAPIWSDLRTFDGRPWRGVVDLVSAGFPCQPFSQAGARLGTADPRWLWPAIERIVGECEPGLVFLENVPGLVRRGLDQVLQGLARLGFDAEWDVFSAEDVGAPRVRKRLFLLAHTHGRGREELRLAESAWEPSALRDEPDGRGAVRQLGDAALADTGSRLPSDGSAGEDGRDPQEPSGRRSEVADPSSQGLPPPEREELPGVRGRPEGGAATERGGWAVEPDVGRVASRTPDRVDRLRAIGNGVVPLVVAHAFRTLCARCLTHSKPT